MLFDWVREKSLFIFKLERLRGNERVERSHDLVDQSPNSESSSLLPPPTPQRIGVEGLLSGPVSLVVALVYCLLKPAKRGASGRNFGLFSFSLQTFR